MKKMPVMLVFLGILGIVFVCTIDLIMGKPVNDFTGPKSTPTLVISAILIVMGIVSFKRKKS